MAHSHTYRNKRVNQLITMLITPLFLILIGCTHSSKESSKSENVDGYEDGKYCADVTYYNPNTGTNRTYSLNVEIENRELTKIYWPNGGWLDDSHFRPQEIDKTGTCSFTSDKGYQYDIKITGEECSFTDAGTVLEENDEPKEFTLTLEQCASSIKMSENELAEYEKTFKVSRTDIINEKMCNLMFDYIQKHRELMSRKNALDELIENGYIQKIRSVGLEGDIPCQTLIVKRRGYYYLMGVQGRSKATMGLMDFDPSIGGWQEVKILENPTIPDWHVLIMKVIDKSADLNSLVQEMEIVCNNQ